LTDLNRELPDSVVSADDIEDVLQKLDASNIPVADSEERLIEQRPRSRPTTTMTVLTKTLNSTFCRRAREN